MLHAKFQDHSTSGSGEGFQRFSPYMDMAALVIVIWTIKFYANVCSPFPRRLHMKFGFGLPSRFRGVDL